MSEITLGQLLDRECKLRAATCLSFVDAECIARHVGDEAIRRWKESDEGRAWRDAAVAKWLAELPPGDEGLGEAYWTAREVVSEKLTDITTRWQSISDFTQSCVLAGVAAALEVHRRRLADDHNLVNLDIMGVIGNEMVFEALGAKGWLPPDQTAKLRLDADSWKEQCDAALVDAETRDEENIKLQAENVRLKNYVEFHERLARKYGADQSYYHDDLAKLRAEVERLREVIREVDTVIHARMVSA